MNVGTGGLKEQDTIIGKQRGKGCFGVDEKRRSREKKIGSALSLPGRQVRQRCLFSFYRLPNSASLATAHQRMETVG